MPLLLPPLLNSQHPFSRGEWGYWGKLRSKEGRKEVLWRDRSVCLVAEATRVEVGQRGLRGEPEHSPSHLPNLLRLDRKLLGN